MAGSHSGNVVRWLVSSTSASEVGSAEDSSSAVHGDYQVSPPWDLILFLLNIFYEVAASQIMNC